MKGPQRHKRNETYTVSEKKVTTIIMTAKLPILTRSTLLVE